MQNYEYLVEVEKFNPYHDSRGRFTTPDGATQFTYAPGKSKAHDMAIARAKERHKEAEAKSKEAIAAQKESIATAKTKKGEFDIYLNNIGKGQKGRHTVSGRIDAENGIGYHKEGSGRHTMWKTTDIATGLAFGPMSNTLKGAQQTAAGLWERVMQVKSGKRYAETVNEFKNAAHI